MRLTDFMIVIIAALMFLIPTMKREAKDLAVKSAGFAERPHEIREAQEEETVNDLTPLGITNSFRIRFEVQRPEDASIADILWMKKAAAVAIDAGVPYFNVREQKIRTRYDLQLKQELPVVEGVIDLDEDPMRAEYDAVEIEALVLHDRPQLEE